MRRIAWSWLASAWVVLAAGCGGSYVADDGAGTKTPGTAAAADAVQVAAPDATGITLNAIFSNGAVLQRDTKVPVWGTSSPGGTLVVSIAGSVARATADDAGAWRADVGPLAAGGPFELTVAGAGAETVTVSDVLVGEVWVCSGQSNMQFSTSGSVNSAAEIADANFPQIRLLNVRTNWSLKPLTQVDATWTVCSPATVGGFSAIGYFFGRHIHRDLGVPVGLIANAWGGTPAQAWTSLEALGAEPELAHYIELLQTRVANLDKSKEEIAAQEKRWEEAAKFRLADNQGEPKGWAAGAFDDAGWKTMDLPQLWEDAGLKIDGSVWFRRTVDVPAAWAGADLKLELGAIDDFDTTYWNGQPVGRTGADTPDFWQAPRVYTVPGAMVKAGSAVIAVRAFDHYGGGGFHGDRARMRIGPAAASPQGAVSLAGPWRYEIEHALTTDEVRPTASSGGGQNLPGTLYNARINPLVPYGIRGAIWYQGESNAGQAYQYRTLFRVMIRDWRRAWGRGEFPFGFVQLANFMAAKPEPGESAWAELREAQLMALAEPNTGQAVAIDVGDAKDIHPKNKQDVGKRLGLWALATIYGRPVEYSGPAYRSMTVEGDRIRLSFDHVGGGLVARDGDLRAFAIAGEDRVFRWASARIDGATVVVSGEGVAAPVAVRYAWADNPEGCNFYNAEGLPASPFRTDAWPGVTAPKK